jgi:hypothetical protein
MKTVTYDETKYVLLPIILTENMVRVFAVLDHEFLQRGFDRMIFAAPKIEGDV